MFPLIYESLWARRWIEDSQWSENICNTLEMKNSTKHLQYAQQEENGEMSVVRPKDPISKVVKI